MQVGWGGVGWGGAGWGGVEWSGVQIQVPCLHQIESIQTQCRAQCVLYLLQAHIFGWVRLRTRVRVRSCVRMYVLCVCVCVENRAGAYGCV